MGYQKLLIDNVTCSRRFHVTFDPEAPAVPEVNVKCPFCDFTVFTAKNHPPVILARQENLVQTMNLSDNIVRTCEFSDTFKVGGVGKVYKDQTVKP